jgi:hypothetical protein
MMNSPVTGSFRSNIDILGLSSLIVNEDLVETLNDKVHGSTRLYFDLVGNQLVNV